MIRCLFILLIVSRSFGMTWTPLLLQSGVARDFAMGGATGAMFGSTSATSANPAGIVAFPLSKRTGVSSVIQANGAFGVRNYFENSAEKRSSLSELGDVASHFVRSVSARHRWAAVTAILAEPVMHRSDSSRFDGETGKQLLAEYQTSVVLNLLLHPRVQVGGRVDFYSRSFQGDGEGFTYGVILKPRGVQVGLHYQRFPVTGPRWLHPLDRRIDKGTTASVAVQQEDYSLAFQLGNLSSSGALGFLEPRVGAEFRPVRAVALRAGGSLFTRSHGSVATFGMGLVDANWFRDKSDRLKVPDDVLTVGIAILYDKGKPVHGYSTMTLAWRL
ncbi:hypothetical protein HUU59_04135 [bacterium]|nr:hypothetical protein [bacterium]